MGLFGLSGVQRQLILAAVAHEAAEWLKQKSKTKIRKMLKGRRPPEGDRPRGTGKQWGVHTKRKAACVSISGPSLGRKLPRRAAIAGALSHCLLVKTILAMAARSAAAHFRFIADIPDLGRPMDRVSQPDRRLTSRSGCNAGTLRPFSGIRPFSGEMALYTRFSLE